MTIFNQDSGRRFRVLRLPCATLVLLAAAAAAGCSQSPEAGTRGEAGNPITVRLYPVEERTVRRPVQAVGSLFALEESTISAEVEGRVEQVLADVGDNVAEGQVLVTLSTVELQLELDRQRANVSQVRARLGLGAQDLLPKDPAQVAFVQRAAAQLFDAEQKQRRAEEMFRGGLISQEQLDEAAVRFKSARAAHDEALQEVDQLTAQLQASEAARGLAAKKLDDAIIRAPFPGAVKERHVSPGEYLTVQSPVEVIVRTDKLRARLAVPEKYAGSLKQGTTVDIHVEAFPNEIFKGQLVRINPAVSQESRTFEIEALLANPAGRLKPGFFVRATIPSELQENAFTVPEQTVNYRYGVYKVFVVNGAQVEEREVKTGPRQEGRVEVVEGLKAGDRVALAADGELFTGARVREATE